jgi:hypothetical protein
MKPKHFASLVAVLEKWLDSTTAGDDLTSQYIYNDLAEDMAKASALVFDASEKGQEFHENQ